MILLKGSITMLTGEGRITLQIPDYGCDPLAPRPVEETENIPDEFLHEIKSNGRICVGKERGFLFFDAKRMESL